MMRRIFVVIAAILLLLCGCTQQKSSLSVNNIDNKSKINWTPVEEDINIENDSLAISISLSSGEIVITDKNTGAVFSSRHGASIEENSELAELVLKYYDTQSTVHTMNSYDNSIKINTFKVYSFGDSVRFEYEFNEKTADLLVPAVLTTERYEAIKKAIPSKDVQKLSMYYDLIYSSDNTSRVKALKEKYPYLKNNDLYVAFDNLMATEKQKLSDIIKSAGYTSEEYMKDIDSMGISQSEINVPVSFKLPVEYTLTDRGFSAKVCCDELEYTESLATLQSIKLLSGFGICGERAERFILADGSGNIMLLSENEDKFYIEPIYGSDLTVASNNKGDLTQSYRLPICAYSAQSGSWFSAVDSAAEVGYVNAEVAGSVNKADALYYSFDIEAMDRLSIRPGSNMSEVNYYSGKPVTVSPKVDYYFCAGSLGSDRVASEYREIISSKLGLEEKKSNGSLIWLEFKGYEMVDTTVMGIPMQKKVVLSKLSDIIKAVDKLHKNGVRGLNVRLNGFGNYGVNHAAANTFELDKSVGTVEELNKLDKVLKDNGGTLYIENDVSFAYKNYAFDGFSPSEDAAYSLSGSLAYKSDFDLVELDYKKNIDTKYIVSSKNYLAFMEKFAKRLTDKIGKNTVGVSWSAGGRWLFSDYNDKNILDRTDALNSTKSTFKYISDNFSYVMTDGGNLYAIPYSDSIVNVPLYASQYSIKSHDDALYQYLIHGLVDYTGESISTSLYKDELKAKCVEMGAGFLYSCVTEEDAYREFDTYKKPGLFAPVVKKLIEQIINDYKLYGDFYKQKSGCTMNSRTEVQEGVYKTEYSNGSFSIANNNDNTVNIYGIEIAGKDVYLRCPDEIK